MDRRRACVWLAVLLGGCAAIGDGVETESVYFEADNGILIHNGLTLANGLTLPNGIDLANGITGPYIAPPLGSGLEQWIDVDPPMQLRILRYLMECALPPGQEVQLLYHDQLSILGYGVANLAPGLQAGVMSQSEKEKVTSCLLARSNARGAVVGIDMFGPMAGFHESAYDDRDFPYVEAAFFGNLFSPTPQAYVCTAAQVQCEELRACEVTGQYSCDCGVMVSNAPHCRAQSYYSRDYCGVDYTSDGRRGFYVRCTSPSSSGGQTNWNYPITAYVGYSP